MPPVNLRRIPSTTTGQLRRKLERIGYVPDESNHSHIKLIDANKNEITFIKGNKEMVKVTIKDAIKAVAKHKGITEEDAFILIYENGKKK